MGDPKRGEKYSERRAKSLAKKFERAMNEQMDYMLEKLSRGEGLKPEEIRILKNFESIMAKIHARRKAEKTKPLENGALKSMLERERLKTRLGGDSVMKQAGYYKCLKCGFWHKKTDECPYNINSQLKSSEPLKSK